MGIFTKKEINALKEHEYFSEGSSLCEPIMQVLWNWLFKMIPATLAPNLLTLAGLLTNILTTLIMVYYNPDGKREVSGWVYLTCAFGVISYQALDALDGKQSRRTRGSPVEDLYDHGFDTISTVCVMLGCCFCLKLGQSPMVMLFQMCLAELCCYTAFWQQFVTGVMRFGKVDVTEGQLVAVFIYIMSAISPSVFDTSIPGLNIPLRYVCVIGSMAASILFILRQLSIILKGRSSKTTSKVQTSGTLFPAIPIGLAIGLQVTMALTTSMYNNLPWLYLITFGLIKSKLTVRLIVAIVTKGNMPLFDWILLGPIILLMNQMIGFVFIDDILLFCVHLYSLQNWIFYFWTVTIEICEHLNIYCFDVTSRPYPSRRMSPAKQ